MTQLRIEVNELPPRIQRAIRELRPGDEVIVEDAGVAVAEVIPCKAPSGSLAAFMARRASHPPVDEEFLMAVEEAVARDNQPPPFKLWQD